MGASGEYSCDAAASDGCKDHRDATGGYMGMTGTT